MIDEAWASERNEDAISLTHIKTAETAEIYLRDINNITEEILQDLFNDTLSDKDVMLAFRILFGYIRIR
jgi:hypothetical protein